MGKLQVEVEWEVTIKSGITNIDLDDLGCSNPKQWDNLSKTEKDIRMRKALMDYDGPMIEFKVTDYTNEF